MSYHPNLNSLKKRTVTPSHSSAFKLKGLFVVPNKT